MDKIVLKVSGMPHRARLTIASSIAKMLRQDHHVEADVVLDGVLVDRTDADLGTTRLADFAQKATVTIFVESDP